MQLMRLLTQLIFVAATAAVNFDFELDTLDASAIGNFSDIAFGRASPSNGTYDGPACREHPGSAGWPTVAEWARLNVSLGGSLLKPVPPAAVCYAGPYEDEQQCDFLLQNASRSRFYLDDPLTVLTTWPEGDTCFATAQSDGLNCTQGGFPVYVVNATSVKHIQIAVNFARSRNLRLVIKNTGHDFVGRSTGYGALSIWTHWLKDFEFLPQFSIGEYEGMAARVGAGIESWEMFARMADNNMTVVVASAYTVGAYGGWIAGGGHSPLASKYGLGADQVLSLEVVTADGRFVTADVHQNTDLFYALRGGGGSTYGVVTSAIVKAYPPTSLLMSTLAFSVSNTSTNATETFWRGFDAYHAFGPTIVDAGGTAYSFLSRTASSGYSFSANIEIPGLSASQLTAFVQPLYASLNTLGIAGSPPAPVQASNWTDPAAHGVGDAPGSGSPFGSRLFPRAHFASAHSARFARTQAAVRAAVEAGYGFHGIHLAPSLEAGRPLGGANAANPAFRTAVMHADLFAAIAVRGVGDDEVEAALGRFEAVMEGWREVTGDAGGAYFNEADPLEPAWQRMFFGEANYKRLQVIKRRRDPWGVFYAPLTVGSEEWVTKSKGPLPSQDGPLCRVAAVVGS
ncbi:FAD binding domain-containing protein [Xylariomycetidae sp. FL0641]|nr:FAD binding domain-containing protein [Xylariomycetidae sp. FL0641]